jgi:hypothetical protein
VAQSQDVLSLWFFSFFSDGPLKLLALSARDVKAFLVVARVKNVQVYSWISPLKALK